MTDSATGHYARRLAAGESQIKPVFFEPMVLQRYAGDPHYYFRFDDFNGVLGTADEFYMSSAFPEEDKVLVDSFGQGWADGTPQAIAVFLVYVARLSPRHQGHWHSFELADQGRYELDRDYVRASHYGEWPEKPSAIEAIFEEQRAINDIAAALGRRPLFTQLFDAGDRPAGLIPFLLPSREYMDRFVLNLDQVLSDNIDRLFFGDEVELYDDQQMRGGRVQRVPKGTIRLLKEWLEARYPADPNLAATVTKSLAEVRDLRQEPAHRITTNELDPAVWTARARLLGDVHASLNALRQKLADDPAAASVDLPDWLDSPVRTY